MKTVTTVCGTCGAKIPDDATGALCPACLLEACIGSIDEEIASSLCDDRTPQRRVPSGARSPRSAKVLGDFGDYELLQEIGRGGQGVVYRAHQKSLNRTVALKVVGLGPWTTETHVKRFRREAEAAAHLEHRSIVPIYEVGEREGACYFSMKFVDSGQLDEVVRRAPMSITCAVELMAKVARTVHYAHQHGILHRDIKPGNILLDKHGEPHLTDFGLARLGEADSTITRTRDALGTPSYMAPEQAAGETTKLSKATDVYGLGAVLYQLLTGQPPFAGGTTYETIKLLLETEPRQPRVLNRKIDRELSTICLKCLNKNPKQRYSSALALAEDLEHWLKHEPIQAKPSGSFTRARKWVRRNPSTTVLATSLVALALGFGVMIWNRQPGVIIPKSIAVLPFENLSDDANNAYLAEGIHEEILTRLASIAGLKVISRTSTRQYQSKPRNLRDIAKQLGVENILEGSVQRAADQVRVTVQLINAQTDSHIWAETYDRTVTDIFGLESDIAKEVTDGLRVNLTTREERALTVKPTNNPEAYDAYLRALALDARTRPSYYNSDLESEAISSCGRAVQLDPNFAIAWAQLSRMNAHLYFNERDSALASRSRGPAERALENAQKLTPNSPETLLALGYYQYWVLHEYRLAKTTFTELSKLLPGNSEIVAALGHVTETEGHLDESIAYFEQALALDPRNIDLLLSAAGTYAKVRQFPLARKLYDRALDVIPNDPQLMADKASMYQAEGNLQESAKLLIDVNERTDMNAFQIKLHQLRLERNHAEAIRLLQALRTELPAEFEMGKRIYLVYLANFQRLVGDTAGAKVTAEQARNALEPLCLEPTPFFGVLLGLAEAVLGERDPALTLEREILTDTPIDDAKLAGDGVYLAMIQTIFGENSRAISTLTRLLKTTDGYIYSPAPVTPALLRLDPMWDPLRGDPAFQKLCEDKHR
jgi:TolB-like protein/tetratricopeptide (TPR) repeat protein/predicted Ser/Thr protein kinase